MNSNIGEWRTFLILGVLGGYGFVGCIGNRAITLRN